MQRDVPVGDDDEPVAGGAQLAQRVGHVVEHDEAQRRQQRLAERTRAERAQRLAVRAGPPKPCAQDLGTARPQPRERGGVDTAVVMRAVVGDLLAQRRPGLRLAHRDAARPQRHDKAPDGIVELDERAERVEADYATQCHVAKIPV